VADNELEKAKNILIADFYRSLKTIDGKARDLGNYEVFFGDYRKLFTAADSYSKVTKDDLQRVAKKYFTDKNRTVATLVPEAEEAPNDSSRLTTLVPLYLRGDKPRCKHR
jgi:predicted Zn-dependent peptidase